MKKPLAAILALLMALLIFSCTAVPTIPPETTTTTIETTTEPAPPEPVEIRIQFAGDVLLHTGPVDAARIGQDVYDFRPFVRDIKPFVDGDLTLVNMETPVDAFGGNQNISSWPRFNVPFEVLEALRYAGFNHLIAANNHSFDRGFDGMVATIRNFERAGLAFTGIYEDEAAFNTPSIVDVNGIQVGIIAYTDSFNGLETIIPPEVLPFAARRFVSYSLASIPAMEQDIANLREAGAELVIVSLHWGAEYVDEPRYSQRQVGRALVDAGADVIMGHHSHTVQPIEWHTREDGSRGLIMYSLGNFLADQTRLDPPISRTQYSKLVSLQVTRMPDGEIILGECEVLPVLAMRDRSGNTMGMINGVGLMPLIGGEMPQRVTDPYLRAWGQRAYAHVTRIVGAEFIQASGGRTQDSGNTSHEN